MAESKGIMKKMLDVAVLIPCRDGEKTLSTTIHSLLSQKVETFVAVADDASVDNTPRILEDYSKTQKVRFIRYSKREPRDYARVPVLLNMLLAIAPSAYFYMISGDDCVYPPDYLRNLISLMQRDKVDLASGYHGFKDFEHLSQPGGSGRLVSAPLFRKITPLPSNIGWESWMIYKAQSLGRKTAIYPLRYEHKREYSFASTRTFGYSAYVNGVPFIFVLFRAVKSLILGIHKPINAISIPLGYLECMIKRPERLDSARFVESMHKSRIKETIAGIVGG